MIPVRAVLAGTEGHFPILDPHPGVVLRQNAADVLVTAVSLHVFAEEHVFRNLQSLLALGGVETKIVVIVFELLEGAGQRDAA